MYQILENAVMDSDMDAQNNSIRNVATIVPTPTNLAPVDDPRFSDARMPIDGSVTDASVSFAAGIQQSKINLNGVVPPAWLGPSPSQAAPGDKAEYTANKDQPGGYPGLDSSGKIDSSAIPGAAGLGTVTSVGLNAAPQFAVGGSPITGAGTLLLGWASAPAYAWFGNNAPVGATPQWNTTPFPASLIPGLDGSKIVSGLIAQNYLPAATGIGNAAQAGLVPNPGPIAPGAFASDYLARDMTYKPIPVIPTSYRPQIPNPQFDTTGGLTGPINVYPKSIIAGVNWFGSTVGASGPFTELTTGNWVVPPLGTVWIYAARAGYADSAIIPATNSNPT